jgi:hypothetical protein
MVRTTAGAVTPPAFTELVHQGNCTCFDSVSKSLTFDRRPFLRFFVLLLQAFQTST